MTPFEQVVVDEVRRRGRITFAEFMDWALYHPRYGYYMTGPLRTGRQGDFFTSVQVGGLFGRMLAESFCEMWDQLGSGRFTLVELGGGDGSMAEQVLKALEGKGRAGSVTYYLVEKSPFGREAARKRLSRFPKLRILEDLRSLEHVSGVEGCIFSNEFFDALPFHRVQWKDGALRELYVHEKEGRLGEEPGEPSTPALAGYLREEGVSLEEGQKAEICLLLGDVVAEMERVLSRGFILSIDYGRPTQDLYDPARMEGGLQTYQKHKREGGPFEDVGSRDITTLVDFGRLASLGKRVDLAPLVFVSQGTYFINSAEGVLREAVPSSPAQVQQLVHPESFGGKFHVLVQGKNVGQPSLSGGKVNRIQRLGSPGNN